MFHLLGGEGGSHTTSPTDIPLDTTRGNSCPEREREREREGGREREREREEGEEGGGKGRDRQTGEYVPRWLIFPNQIPFKLS